MTPPTPLILLTLAASVAAAPRAPRERSVPDIPLRMRLGERIEPGPLHDGPTGEFRSIDGSGNHLADPTLGMPGQPMIRMCPSDYGDGRESPAGGHRRNPREISNAVAAQEPTGGSKRRATDLLWQWGQFLDHDIDETRTLDPPEAFDIPVPVGDPWFDPGATGEVVIPLDRSLSMEVAGIREQVNEITCYIDASNVYGSDPVRAAALRRMDGSGKLKTTPSDHGDLLPYNAGGHDNAPDSSGDWFIAGDVRANEQVGLTAMHTLWVREHNHWAERYGEAQPGASEDEVFEFARRMVGAEMQHITYREFLPVLLGPMALPPYRGFDDRVDPRIANEFATAAYRIGHSLLSPVLRRIGADGATLAAGDLPLREAFFNPEPLVEHGIEPVLRGLASQGCEELDGMIVDDVRNFMFGHPGAGGLDLGALNIQRGRDHGLPSYNAVRIELGLRPARRFRDIHPDRDIQVRLASVYDTPDEVDLWVGGLCERHVPGAMVGPTFHRILADQFRRLRDGDRFWYEAALEPGLLRLVRRQTLAEVIRRNTGIDDEIQDRAFLLAPPSPPRRPTRLPGGNRRKIRGGWPE